MTTISTTHVARPAPTLDHPFLGGRPQDVALVADDQTLTYDELGTAVRIVAAELGTERRLVMIEASNNVRTVVTYLAALAGHHPILLVEAGDRDRQAEIQERYSPDVLCGPAGRTHYPPAEPPVELHPDLAVLLSTSGSTGSPKLVRLSRDNLLANASSIVDYLGIRSDDRAMSSLPLHYCYGLSVLNSHLVAGAAVVLSDLSVADRCFWDRAAAAGVSSISGVPYTFDLLDAIDFALLELPNLRYVTQAGGRMAPEKVARYAEIGRRRGWDLYVMYGQTEATARMAYLPPDLASTRPSAIGVPIPGGSFRLAPTAGQDAGVGELVYTGPNVMMGYAHTPADLARGHETPELHTGDLARRGEDGIWEITGRLNRQAKVFGLRIDLERVERQLADRGCTGRVVSVDDALHVFVDDARRGRRAAALLAELTSLPTGAVRAHVVDAVPLTGSGKCDYAALARHAGSAAALASDVGGREVSVASVRDLYAVVLGRPDARADDTFVSLGGDSLSFVEVSTRLGRLLGDLPPGWPGLSIADLAGRRRRRRFTVPVETTVLLRAVAILLVVATHTDVVMVPGGAHVLLAVAGYNLARFTLKVSGRRARTRRILRSVWAVALPASLWIGACAIVAGDYHPSTAIFLNGLVGGDGWSLDWQFWFLEALIWGTLGAAALLAVPRVDHWQRRRPFECALAVTLAALVIRYLVVGVEALDTEKYAVSSVLWALALGWAAAEARTLLQRLLVVGVAIVATLGFFGDTEREVVVALGVAALLLSRPVFLPGAVVSAVRLVAGASLWIYLTHWQVYPGLEAAGHPYVAIVASVAVGLAGNAAYARTTAAVSRRSRERASPRWRAARPAAR